MHDFEFWEKTAAKIIGEWFYVMDIMPSTLYWGPTSSSSTPRFYPSRCKHPMSSKWTMVAEGNLYHWNSPNTRQAS